MQTFKYRGNKHEYRLISVTGSPYYSGSRISDDDSLTGIGTSKRIVKLLELLVSFTIIECVNDRFYIKHRTGEDSV